jgi:YebC/PmpR family DNA-binding regulatory protein
MPKDNIARAIKRGTGELGGDRVEEVVYEGYGPGGVAVMCESLTDNRNRTAPELRLIFSKLGGELGKTGCVSYLFERKGLFVFDSETADEEQVTEIALENGGEDVDTTDDGKLQVTSSPDQYQTLAEAFETAELVPEVKEVTLIPQTTVEVDASTGKKAMRLLEQLDDHDDVQNVSTNLNITDDLLDDASS